MDEDQMRELHQKRRQIIDEMNQMHKLGWMFYDDADMMKLAALESKNSNSIKRLAFDVAETLERARVVCTGKSWFEWFADQPESLD